MQELSKEAFGVTDRYPSANLDLIFDSGIPDPDLIALDYDHLKKDAAEMCRIYLDDSIPFSGKSAIVSYIDARINEASNVLENGHSWYSKCGNGFRVFNVDLSGNLYSCHNNRERVGGIDTDPIQTYAAAVRTDKVYIQEGETLPGMPGIYGYVTADANL